MQYVGPSYGYIGCQLIGHSGLSVSLCLASSFPYIADNLVAKVFTVVGDSYFEFLPAK